MHSFIALLLFGILGLIAIAERDFKIGRPVVEVIHIFDKLAFTTDSIQDLLLPFKQETENPNDGQLYFDFKLDKQRLTDFDVNG